MSGSARPCHLSGSGRIDLASSSRLVDLDGDLAGTRGHHGALGADPVAAVERLDVGERVVADDRLGDEQLDVDAAVGDREEHQLAGVALEHHPAADGDGDVGLRRPGRGRRRAARTSAALWRAVEAVGVRLPPRGAQLVDLPLAAGALGGEPAAGRGRRFVVAGRVALVSASATERDGFGSACEQLLDASWQTSAIVDRAGIEVDAVEQVRRPDATRRARRRCSTPASGRPRSSRRPVAVRPAGGSWPSACGPSPALATTITPAIHRAGDLDRLSPGDSCRTSKLTWDTIKSPSPSKPGAASSRDGTPILKARLPASFAVEAHGPRRSSSAP